MEGILIFDGLRPDITFYNGTTYGGLHCGDCFLCFTDEKWSLVRLVWNDGWTLWENGCVRTIQYGARVKMPIP